VKTFTKRDLTDVTARKGRITQNEARDVVQMFLDNIRYAVLAGHRVELRNFGVFALKVRKPRRARNPRTGETISLPERHVVSFKSGLSLRPTARANA
jgi:nucleoid DNA-binding protein